MVRIVVLYCGFDFKDWASEISKFWIFGLRVQFYIKDKGFRVLTLRFG
jgi:hypothetical protein